MTRISLCALFVLATVVCTAQKEDYQWLFNYITDCSELDWLESCGGSVLDFNHDPPLFYQEKRAEIDLGITNAQISDLEGVLLLISNCMTIHGKDYKVLTNADTINYDDQWEERIFQDGEYGGFDIGSGAVFVPRPGYTNRYYLLYNNYVDLDSTGYLNQRYAEIELDDEGIGRVLSRDVVFANPVSSAGQLVPVQHANGRDWWLIQHQDNTLLTYLIDETGINLYREEVRPELWSPDSGGMTKFSPQGDKFAIFQRVESQDSFGNELVIADFDRCSGISSNIKIDRFSSFDSTFGNGLEFSSSGRYLYANDARIIRQYDTWASDIFASIVIVATYDGFTYTVPELDREENTPFGRMQKGPDNKIYLSTTGVSNYLHVIHYPEQAGLASTVEQHAIFLPTYNFGTTPTFPTLRLGPIDGSSCDTLGIDNLPVARFRYEQDSLDYLSMQFVDLSFYEPDSWQWTFGDGATSTDRFPTHSYTEDGVYEVCQTVSNRFSNDTSCDTLYLGVSAIGEHTTERNITLFPNPVEDLTRVAMHDYLPQQAVMKVYSHNGTLVQQEQLLGVVSLVDLSSLEAGVYVYEIWDGRQLLKVGKVVKI